MKLLKGQFMRLISFLRVNTQALKKIMPKHQRAEDSPQRKTMEEALRVARESWDRGSYSNEPRAPDQLWVRDENVPMWEPDKPKKSIFTMWDKFKGN
jgi:hypothetical protein